jgi:hypothetical protein
VVVISAACGGGSATGTATLTNVGVKASAIEPKVLADAAGTKVHAWEILMYEQEAGGDCLEGTVLAKIAIYTNVPATQGEQALLTTGSISIVTDTPPSTATSTAANMGAEGVGTISGLVDIQDFHRTADNMHGDRIKGTVSAAGFDSADQGVALTGTFDAPLCVEE